MRRLKLRPRVNCSRNDETIGRYVARVESLCFESIVIDWALEDPVVVVIVVVDVEDTVVIMVEWVCAVASVKTLDEIINPVVIVIEIIEVTNTIVVVVVSI